MSASRWRTRCPPPTPRESFIATSSRPTSFSPPAGRPRSSILAWPSCCANERMATSDETPIEDSLTAVGVIPGTAVYMSPEQARSEELDPRTDLFSFGVVLYEMATGKKPFSGNNVVTTLDAVLHTKPPSPLTLNPAIPKELEGIIGKAMEKDRGKRYPSAAEMKADLQHLKKETESGLTRTSGRETSRLACRHQNLPEFEQAPELPAARGDGALLITVLAAVGTWCLKHRAATCRSCQEYDCGAAAAEPQRRFQRGLSALRAGRRNRQRAHLFPHPGCSTFGRHQKVRGRRHGSPASRPGAARCHRFDRTLPEAREHICWSRWRRSRPARTGWCGKPISRVPLRT